VIEAIDVALPSSFHGLKLKHRQFDGSSSNVNSSSSSSSSGSSAGDLSSSNTSLSSSSLTSAEELAVAEAAAGAAAGGMLGGLHVAKATRLACRAALLSHRFAHLHLFVFSFTTSMAPLFALSTSTHFYYATLFALDTPTWHRSSCILLLLLHLSPY